MNEHWTDKYERARKAGALILMKSKVRPGYLRLVGDAERTPAYDGIETDYTIVWPAGVVEGLVSAAQNVDNYRDTCTGSEWDRLVDALSPFTSEVGK